MTQKKKVKKQILIYEKDKNVLKFLKSFFRTNDVYSVMFLKRDKDNLRKQLAKMRPGALIVSSPDGLQHMSPTEVDCPVIATVSTNVTDGIRSVVKSDIEYYLLSPFHKEELEHKLKLVTEEKSWIENLYKEKKDLEGIVDLLSLISSTINPQQVLYLMVKKISEMIKVTRCSMISIDVEDQRYASVISTSESPEVTNLKIDLQKYPEIKKVLLLKKPVVVKNASRNPIMKEVRDVIESIGIRSLLVIPVFFRDEIIGTLLLRASRSENPFTKREIRLCTAIANASANVLYNAFLYNKIEKEKTVFEKLAVTDFLTGIYNIRYFYNRLEEEFSRAGRYNTPLSCIMVDIDYFKKINDTYGHRIGDIVLREFAQLVKGYTRKSDIFARYGGEEFIMLLPQTSSAGALHEAERIRKAVKENHFKALKGESEITVSIGIASSPDEKIKTPDDLITLADNALFTAKNKGRDQVVIYPAL